MKPGDKVRLRHPVNPTEGQITRPAYQEAKKVWVVRINDSQEVIMPESRLDLLDENPQNRGV